MTGRRDEAWWMIHQLRKLRWYVCIECDADGTWHVQLGKDCRAEGKDLAEAILTACHMALGKPGVLILQEIIERDLHRLVERWRREDAQRLREQLQASAAQPAPSTSEIGRSGSGKE